MWLDRLALFKLIFMSREEIVSTCKTVSVLGVVSLVNTKQLTFYNHRLLCYYIVLVCR